MRPFIVISLILGCWDVAFGQYVQDSTQDYQPKVNLKLDMSNFLSPNDPALMIYGEYFYTPAVSSNLFAGYVLSLKNFDNQVPEKSFTGYKFGHEFRYFFNTLPDKGKVYIGLNTEYRFLEIFDRYTLGFGCEVGDCDYYKNFVGNIKTDRFSYELRFGYQNLGSGRLMFEFDYGIGYHDFRVRRGSINGGYLVDDSRFLNEDVFITSPYLTFSFKMGYMLAVAKVRK